MPIVLKPLPEGQEVVLPLCFCPGRPKTWQEGFVEIEEAFNSEWLRKGIQEELKLPSPKENFPPRLHGRSYLRKGIDPTMLRIEGPRSEYNLVIDKNLLG